MMTTLGYVLAAGLVLVGMAGAVLPAIPGLPLVFAGLLLAAWLDQFAHVGLWPLVVTIVGARFLAKTGTVLLLARPSGLGWRQALGLGLALQPASGLTVVLTSSTLGWPGALPTPEAHLLQALLIALTLLQLSGPIWLQLGLSAVAQECPPARQP